jgi:hypothetical protein
MALFESLYRAFEQSAQGQPDRTRRRRARHGERQSAPAGGAGRGLRRRDPG